MTLAEVINQRALDVQNEVTQQTQYTFSVYDARQQLIQTIQPAMESANAAVDIGAVVKAGSIGIGFGDISWSGNLTLGQTIAAQTSPSTVKVAISLPSSAYLGTGGVRVEVSFSVAISSIFGPGEIASGILASELHYDNPAAEIKWQYVNANSDQGISMTIRIIKSDADPKEKVVLLEQTWSHILSSGTVGPFGIIQGRVLSSSGSATVPKILYISHQPYVPDNAAASTSQVLLSYRAAGSNGAYTTVSLPQVIGVTGGPIGGMYAFDWTTIPAGHYEYRYVALNSSSVILNQQSGTFNTTNPAAPTASAQTPVPISGASTTPPTITRRQRYNAFGEVVQEIDGRGNVTDFAYNTAGHLVLKRDPKVSITLANGYKQAASEATRPETAYHYDLAGRLIGVRDANGNLNTQ
ncbi:RHS repeat domain-containing protein, partial [Pseudomethylobacillus aquaticus]